MKILFVIISILIIAVLLYLLLSTDNRTVSTYNYTMYDSVDDDDDFYIILNDAIFKNQTVFINVENIQIIRDHPPVNVSYTRFKLFKKTLISDVSCEMISGKLADKWRK